MVIDINNFNNFNNGYELNLCQNDIGGGKITVEQIDEINSHPNVESIIISGLNQDTFEYFINKYGNRFRAVYFFKNKNVSDLSLLAELENIEYIAYFFNQKATRLWDMSRNKRLRGLAVDDFSRLHLLNGIECAPCLDYFSVGNKVWSKMKVDSLKPVAESNVIHFEWNGYKVLDRDYACLARSKIRILDIDPCMFTMEELAQLLSLFPEDIKGSIVKPYTISRIKYPDGTETVTYILCKHKKSCIKGIDDKRFEKYLEDFYSVLESYNRKNSD